MRGRRRALVFAAIAVAGVSIAFGVVLARAGSSDGTEDGTETATLLRDALAADDLRRSIVERIDDARLPALTALELGALPFLPPGTCLDAETVDDLVDVRGAILLDGRLDCDDPHDAEVIASAPIGVDDAGGWCARAFEEITGLPRDGAVAEPAVIVGRTCVVVWRDGVTVTGSLFDR